MEKGLTSEQRELPEIALAYRLDHPERWANDGRSDIPPEMLAFLADFGVLLVDDDELEEIFEEHPNLRYVLEDEDA